MQTKNKIIALTCAITLIIAPTFSFAEDSTTSSSSSSIYLPTDFIAPIPGATKDMPYAGLSTFIKSKDILTTEDNNALISIHYYYAKQVKEVFANTTLTKDQVTAKIYEINKAFFNAVKPYVDPTKMEDYEKWVIQKLSTTTAGDTKPTPTPTNSGSIEVNLFSFLKKKADMTETEYKSMNEVMAYYSKITMAIYADKNLTQEQKLAKSMEAYKAFCKSLRPFIITSKLEAYDIWVAQKIANNNGYGTGVTIPKAPDNSYPPKPIPTTECKNSDVSIANTEIKLTAKITKPYMVSLEWSDYFEKGEEDLLGYKIVIKNAKGDEKVVSVDEDTTEKTDWNSTAGVNVYKVYAITSDGIKHESNSVNIPMNGNGGYDFSLTTPICKSTDSNNQGTGMPEVDKIIKDAQKLGPNIVKKIKFQYKLLSEKTRQLVNKKIDSIVKEKREEYLKNLLVKIDKLIKVTKSSSLISKLQELKQVIQDRLDELTGISEDDSVINDLLNDNTTPTTDSSGTTTTDNK